MELTIEQFFGSGKLNYTANYNFYTPKLEGLMQRPSPGTGGPV